ncbi:MAG: hypothetical protein IH596_07770 [Bacteroidales bacterium]|nr:hypothetical protein [Bacteroidales bacterium]
MNRNKLLAALILFVFVTFCPTEGISQGIKGADTRRHTIRLTKDEGRGTKDEGRRKKDEGRRTKEEGRGKKEEGIGEMRVILMVGEEPLAFADTELVSAMEFVRTLDDYSLKYSTFQELRKYPKQFQEASVVWFHRSDSSAFTDDEADQKVIRQILEYLKNGGSVLLTLDAFPYINLLGVETTVPSVKRKASVDEGYGRKLGFHAFREHPLFSGLHGGAYICKPTHDMTVRVNGFFGDTIPAQGNVVAIDWDYIFFRDSSKVIIEYEVGKGKLMAVGAYTQFALPNDQRLHLETFSKNLLGYLTGKLDNHPRFYWDYSPTTVVECEEKVQNRDVLFDALPEAIPWNIKPDPLAFPVHPATNAYCEAAGERILIMCQEKGGIEEIWTHPFMAIRDFETGILVMAKSGATGQRRLASDSINWLSDLKPEIEIRPDGFIRHYQLDQGILDEVVAADPTLPFGVVHYTWYGDETINLEIRFSTNLRLMWPYAAGSISSICYGWDKDYHAFCFGDKSGDMAVMVGGNKIPLTHEARQGDGFIVDAGMRYSLHTGESLDVAFASGMNGMEEATASFDQAIRKPREVFRRSQLHVEDLFTRSLMVTTPDNNFNDGYKWALLGTDRFFVTTPGMGSALVAGYGTTRRGWDGEQKVSGRPGYAWYFGRDGEWSGLAILDYGDVEKVRKNLEFYLKYQDLNGKILHEATTSGVIHYDASDATPLFLLLAGEYFSKSGDTAFIRSNWKGIKKAIDFCFSTDTDQDHLIENTNVGHGWVEGGKLFGSHSSFYLTGCWVAALEAAGTIAEAIGVSETTQYKQEAKLLRNLIDQTFWNSSKQFYAYGLNKNRSQRSDATILPAVPAYFGLTNQFLMRFLLDKYASNSFSTNWGTRIIGEESPMFKPTGYHYGSVWPLFTGWTALAEYRYGNYVQGFSHIMNNLNGYGNWGLGYVEEVLNGSEYQPSGVCPHQCWSETMVLQPIIEGMLGIDVDAPNRTLNISPRLPADWDHITVKHIRIGDQAVNVSFNRDATAYAWQFYRSGIQPIKVNMMLALPPGTKIGQVMLNEQEYPFASFTTSRFITLQMNFIIDGTTTVVVKYNGGISVLPKVTSPLPGSPAEGMRIIDANLKGSKYLIDLEGLAGSSDTLSVWNSSPADEKSVENGKFLSREGFVTKFLVDFDAVPEKYNIKSVIIPVTQ